MILQGKITRVDLDGQVWAEIAELAIDQEFPCRAIAGPYAPGTFVLVVNIDGAQEDLVIIGSLDQEAIDVAGIKGTFTNDLEVTNNAKGLILKSPNNTRFRITVGNDGSLTTTVI